MQRLVILYSSSARDIWAEIERLDDLFRSIKGYAPSVNMFVGTEWEGSRAFHSLTLYFTPDNENELEFFMTQVKGVTTSDTKLTE
jgi:hypothetical protein